MKFFSLIAGALALGSALAAPFPGSAESGKELVDRARTRTAKYKLATKPPVGKTGVWTDDKTKITHMFYGDDVKVHGSHVEYHNQQYPMHAGKAFKLAGGTSKKGEIANNRRAALSKIKPQGKGNVRDEKPLASLSHGAKRTTVMKVPEKESLIEAHMARIAKSSAKKNGGLVQLHDHRSTTGTGPLGTILKKKGKRGDEEDVAAVDLEIRGLGDKLDGLKDKAKDGVDSLKNKTSSALDGLTQDFQGKFDDFEKKMSGLLGKVTGELKEAGEDVQEAVGQLTFGSGHQMGSFFQGMHNFDAVEEGLQANGTKLSDDDLAQDQAAIDSYMEGFSNATKAIGDDLMNAFFKFTELVLDTDSSDGDDTASAASDIFSVGDWKPEDVF